jgi:hypothetical protein
MEGLTIVRVSDLTQIFQELSQLRKDIKQLKEGEEELKAYSIQQTADMLHLHYNSVRKLVMKGTLASAYLNGDRGKCVIPLWPIKAYLPGKENAAIK